MADKTEIKKYRKREALEAVIAGDLVHSGERDTILEDLNEDFFSKKLETLTVEKTKKKEELTWITKEGESIPAGSAKIRAFD